MRIYLAARYSRYKEMQAYAVDLERAGYTVTSRWIQGAHRVEDGELSGEAAEEKRIQFAQEDFDDLLNADCCISFTEPPRSSNSRGGRHVEFGIALAMNKLVIVVGTRENVFHCLPQVRFYSTWVEALAAFK